MNEYLTSPVTPIVIAVIAIAISVGVLIRVHQIKKLRKEQERRRMELRVAQQLEAERREATSRRLRAASQKGQPLRRSRPQDDVRDVPSRANLTGKPRDVIPSAINRPKTPANIRAPRPSRSSSSSRRNDSYDDGMLMNGALMGGLFSYEEPGRSNDDNSSRDSGSSHSNDSGSSGSGSSWSNDSGGGGSFDSGSSSSSDSGSFGGGDSGSF